MTVFFISLDIHGNRSSDLSFFFNRVLANLGPLFPRNFVSLPLTHILQKHFLIFYWDQISDSVMSNALRPHELQHIRFPCPSPTLELAQTHVHQASDAIQPSHPLLSPSPPAFNLSQHQGLFQWVSSSHQVAKLLEFQLQHQSYQWTPRTDLC